MVSRGNVVYSLWKCRYRLLRRTGGSDYNQRFCELNPFNIYQLDPTGASSGRLAMLHQSQPLMYTCTCAAVHAIWQSPVVQRWGRLRGF